MTILEQRRVAYDALSKTLSILSDCSHRNNGNGQYATSERYATICQPVLDIRTKLHGHLCTELEAELTLNINNMEK